MSLRISIILFATILPHVLFSQWHQLGTDLVSDGNAAYTSLATSTDGVQYIAYTDVLGLGKVVVKKLQNNKWVAVGNNNIPTGNASYLSLKFGPDNTPYILFADEEQGNRLSVYRLQNSQWQQVGAIGFSTANAKYSVLNFAKDGSPIVSFSDADYGYKLTTYIYRSNQWQALGMGGVSEGMVYDLSSTVNSQGQIFIAFRDGANAFRASVYTYSANQWQPVGKVGFSSSGAYYLSIATDSKDSMFLAFVDGTNEYKASVVKYNNSEWQYVGIPGFSEGQARYCSLDIAPSDTLYLAFQDFKTTNKAVVKKFDGTHWQQVGRSGFSNGNANFISLSVNKKGAAFVAFQDGSQNKSAVVMEYSPLPTVWNGNNWSNGIPHEGITALIEADYSAAAFTCFDLIIRPGKEVSIITDTLRVKGNLQIMSDSEAFGSLISSDYIEVSGTSQIDHYLARNHFSTQILPLSIPLEQIQSANNSLLLNNISVYDLSENSWVVKKGSETKSCLGNAYLVSVGDSVESLSFTGTLSSTSFGVNIGSASSSQVAFLGNPYTAYIDWHKLAELNTNANSIGAVYQFNTENTDAIWVNGVSINGGSQFVAPCDIFGINSADYVAKGLQITRDVRVHKSERVPFSQSSGNVALFSIESEQNTDEAAIHYSSDATPDYEQGFDARKFLSTQAGKAQVFCLATQNELLGIQSLAFDFDSLTVPLAVSATTGHTLKFRFDKLSQTPYYYTLLDTYTQSTTYLNESPVYEFTSRKDLDTNRFQLKISKIKPTETLNTEIKVSQTDEKIVIEPLENLATIELFDLNGRRLYVQELVPESENTINLRAYSGVLLLRISGSVQTVRKFWVNN